MIPKFHQAVKARCCKCLELRHRKDLVVKRNYGLQCWEHYQKKEKKK